MMPEQIDIQATENTANFHLREIAGRHANETYTTTVAAVSWLAGRLADACEEIRALRALPVESVPAPADLREALKDCAWQLERRGTDATYDDLRALSKANKALAAPAPAPAGLDLEAKIAGALFDFAGYLTGLPESFSVGASEWATPMVEHLTAWAKKRGLPLENAKVMDWHAASLSPRPATQPQAQPSEADRLTPEQIEQNKETARAQFSEAKGPTKITCTCGRSIPIRFAYKCLYCDIFRCMACAEEHFGKSRKDYFAERHPAPATGARASKETGVDAAAALHEMAAYKTTLEGRMAKIIQAAKVCNREGEDLDPDYVLGLAQGKWDEPEAPATGADQGGAT